MIYGTMAGRWGLTRSSPHMSVTTVRSLNKANLGPVRILSGFKQLHGSGRSYRPICRSGPNRALQTPWIGAERASSKHVLKRCMPSCPSKAIAYNSKLSWELSCFTRMFSFAFLYVFSQKLTPWHFAFFSLLKLAFPFILIFLKLKC
jgi:hypothetical protein